MPEYRRYFTPGGTFFFTVVTEQRTPIFADESARAELHRAINDCRQRWLFDLEAIVLLPDHLHTIWTLPSGDTEYSRRWAWLKRTFTVAWLAGGGAEQEVTTSRNARRSRGVWQRRYWEHTIRDPTDFERHVDYIHYNPVKHGLATCPHAWPYSSFTRWVKRGTYPADWGCRCGGRAPAPIKFDDLNRTARE